MSIIFTLIVLGNLYMCLTQGSQNENGFMNAFNAGFESDSERLRPGDTVNNRYFIQEILGEGGEGKMFGVLDTKYNVPKVLKVLLGTRTPGDLKQIRKLIKLPTPSETHLLIPIAIFPFDGSSAMVYERMEKDLREMAKVKQRNNEVWTIDELQTLLGNILTALFHLHKIGLVHGDVKKENILIRRNQYYLGDLGLIRPPSSPPRLSTLIMRRIGTPFYAPPEYITKRILVPAYDIWALGMTVLTLLSNIPCANKCEVRSPWKQSQINFEYLLLRSSSTTNLRSLLNSNDVKYAGNDLRSYNRLKDLLELMLDRDPERRISSENALKHNFFEIK